MEIADSVMPVCKTAAEMPRLYDISQPTVSRIVAEHRRLGRLPDAGTPSLHPA